MTRIGLYNSITSNSNISWSHFNSATEKSGHDNLKIPRRNETTLHHSKTIMKVSILHRVNNDPLYFNLTQFSRAYQR